jgi:LysR family hca operon transcriptional activator
MRGKIDLAFLRRECNAPGIVFTRLIDEPLIVLMSADHRLAARDAITTEHIAGEQLVSTSPRQVPGAEGRSRRLWPLAGDRSYA